MRVDDAKLAELDALSESDAQPTCWRLPNGVGVDGVDRRTLADLLADLRETKEMLRGIALYGDERAKVESLRPGELELLAAVVVTASNVLSDYVREG